MATLLRTARFDVWSLGGETGIVKKDEKKNDPSKTVAAGAGRKVLVSDVAKVAALHYAVSLDSQSLEKIDAELTQVKGVPFDFKKSVKSFSAATTAVYPVTIGRAAVFARISSLMQGKSAIRSEVIQLLADMLDAGVVPNFTSAENAGTELVAALSGADSTCYFQGAVLSTPSALRRGGLAPVQLFADEAATLQNGLFFSTGVAALVASGAANIISTADSVAALSGEAFGVNVDHFDAVHFDTCRQHRGQMASASNLRLMLEGSKRINSSSKPGLSFENVPQVNGPAQDSITVAIKALEIELNSSENGVVKDKSFGYDPAQSLLALRSIVASLGVLLASSTGRLDALGSTSGSVFAESLNDAGSANDEYSESLGALYRLAASYGSELRTALVALESIEGVKGKAAGGGDGEEDEEQGSAGKPSKEGKGEGKNLKPSLDESNWTPEQRAKAEAKRKAKADKAAQKNAAKEAKRGGASGADGKGQAIVLGVGSTLIRNHVTSKCIASGTSATETRADAFAAVADPFNVTDDGFSSFCAKLVEQLGSGGEKRRPKIPKGTRDYAPEQMRIREQVFATIRRVFKRHGGVEIDTPVFELKEVLMGKYGEDSKLIYDLADQGGELLSLRYDLTVPFARFLAMNSVGNIKRYHIAKVYRRDQPQLNRGRYREFYQCDFDVAGSYSPMVPDAEVITVAAEILSELPVGKFLIKLNHRRLLDAIFDICGVPMTKFRPICSAVDKLDKSPWEEVKNEMVFEKGLTAEVADSIGEFVLQSGRPKDLWKTLSETNAFGDHVGANAAMKDLFTLFEYLDAMGSLEYVSFDLSLARGLDYYTGVIYEVVLIDGVSQVGSISAGGRYDNLVGMFSPSNTQTPCVGVSIGVERVFTIIEKKAEELKILQASPIQVYIASIGAGLVPERMRVAKLLWSANIPAEYSHQDNPKFKKQLDEALERGVPYMVVFGEDERKKGVVKVKNMKEHEEVEVPLNQVVDALLAKGCMAVPAAADLAFLTALKGDGV